MNINKLSQNCQTIYCVALFFLMLSANLAIANNGTLYQSSDYFQNLNLEFVSIDTTDKEVFKVVEQMPRFPGCEELSSLAEKRKCGSRKMLEFIYKNLEYPDEARKKGVHGTVVIQFIVTKSGDLEDLKVIRSIGGGCDEAALKVVQMMPNWIAGMQRGKNVDVQFNLPIKFLLDKKTIEETPKQKRKRLKKG